METPKAVLAETGPGGKPSIRRNFEEETRTLPNDFRKIQGGTPRNLINKYKGLITVNKLIVAFLAAFLVSGAMADGHDFPDVPANPFAFLPRGIPLGLGASGPRLQRGFVRSLVDSH